MHRRIGKAADALAQLLRISERRTLRSRRRSMDDVQIALDGSLVPTGHGLVMSLRALEETVRRLCRLLEQQSLARRSPGPNGGRGRESAVDRPLHCESSAADRRDKVRDGRGAVAMKTLIEITASECVSYAIRLGLVRG